MVINEVKEAERILQTNKYDKFSSAVALLIRYYIQIKELNKSDVKDEIKKFLILNHQEYDFWEKSIDKMIKKANEYPLCQIDEIPITQKEIDTIYQAGSEKKEKILFTFLVLGKLKWMKTGKAWVNDTGFLTFKRANAETKTDERDYIIRDFKESGFISYAQSPMNMSIHIDFIDNTSDTVLVVNDLRELGYRWLKFKGRRYVECNECGKLFKPNGSHSLYCKEHRGYIPLVTKIIECKDCGNSFEAPATSPGKRCPLCSKLRRNAKQRELMRKRSKLAKAL